MSGGGEQTGNITVSCLASGGWEMCCGGKTERVHIV